METAKEPAQENHADQTKTPTPTKYVREVRVNYCGPKKAPTVVRMPFDIVKFARGVLPDNSREHVIAIYLDGAHQIIGYAVVATGTANACPVHPREVFQRAVLIGAVAVVIAHNHPTGQTEPSAEDEKITKTVKEAGEILGIKLLDHVIVTQASHSSFTEMGRL